MISSTRIPVSCVALLLASAASLPAQSQRLGQVSVTYSVSCASCHGPNLEGGSAPSMLDDVWVHGGDDESLARVIKQGVAEKGMPAWGATMSDKEIRAMVIYIRERRARAASDLAQRKPPAESVTLKSERHDFQVKTWVNGVKEPWSLAFLDENRAVVSEKQGRLVLIENGKLAAQPISGLPAIDTDGQAGLFDVVAHPDYAKNGWLYLAFSDLQKTEGGKSVSLTRIIRGKLRDGALVDQENIFQAPVALYPGSGGVHFGGRIVFDGKGYLYFSMGERGYKPNAQNLEVPMGKVHRIFDDGRVPTDNPKFVSASGAPSWPTIWSYGHRNPQGLAMQPGTGDLYDVEHGPRGGDEVNLVRPGLNYGWPLITYGMDYDGTAISEFTAKDGLEQPVRFWVPSIAPCGASFYNGALFPHWKANLFVASLAAEELHRIEFKDQKVVTDELLFKGLGRIRHVIGGPDGALYVLLPNRIARLTPAPAAAVAQRD